ncbi:hypothetical protein [Inquilinus sp.]|jgi:hypothetical protein|uniref:hypothetical protein n=1 Tax=Inquilinus sp. TaxID=1932117 RepID=UPI00378327E0
MPTVYALTLRSTNTNGTTTIELVGDDVLKGGTWKAADPNAFGATGSSVIIDDLGTEATLSVGDVAIATLKGFRFADGTGRYFDPDGTFPQGGFKSHPVSAEER